MVRHSGGKLTKAAKTLSSKKSSAKSKSNAGKVLQQHKQNKH